MGVLQRARDILASNVNAILDKCEDPAKMVDQMLLDARRDLADVKRETAGVMAEQKAAQRSVDELQADIDKASTAAMNALKSNDEEGAKKLIARKQQLEANLPQLKANLEVATKNADQMREMHDKLVADIESMEIRKSTIKATAAQAKAQQRMNKVTAGTRNRSSASAAFDRMEDKAQKALDAAMAEAELNAGGDGGTSELLEKYSSGSTASVDDELARMKAQLNGGQN